MGFRLIRIGKTSVANLPYIYKCRDWVVELCLLLWLGSMLLGEYLGWEKMPWYMYIIDFDTETSKKVTKVDEEMAFSWHMHGGWIPIIFAHHLSNNCFHTLITFGCGRIVQINFHVLLLFL